MLRSGRVIAQEIPTVPLKLGRLPITYSSHHLPDLSLRNAGTDHWPARPPSGTSMFSFESAERITIAVAHQRLSSIGSKSHKDVAVPASRSTNSTTYAGSRFRTADRNADLGFHSAPGGGLATPGQNVWYRGCFSAARLGPPSTHSDP